MIITIIILSILLTASILLGVFGWYVASAIRKDGKAAEDLLNECQNLLEKCKEEIESKASWIDPSTIQFGTAICDIEYETGSCGEIIDMSRYYSDGVIGVTLLSPDPRPLDIDPAAPPIVYPHSMVYKGPVGWTWRNISFPHSG